MPAAVAAAKQLLREHVQCSVTTSAAAAAAAEASKQSATSEEGRTAPEGAITKLTAGGTAVAALQLLLDAEWCAKAWRERLVEWAEVPEEERELEDTHPLSNDKGAAVSTVRISPANLLRQRTSDKKHPQTTCVHTRVWPRPPAPPVRA